MINLRFNRNDSQLDLVRCNQDLPQLPLNLFPSGGRPSLLAPIPQVIQSIENDRLEKALEIWANEGDPSEQRSIAKNRILECFVNKSCILDLSNLNLKSLPTEISSLDSLNFLNLEHNQLTNLPPTFGLLSNLKVLHLEHNQLTNLPPTFGLLSNLKVLYLEHNQFPNSSCEFNPLFKNKLETALEIWTNEGDPRFCCEIHLSHCNAATK